MTIKDVYDLFFFDLSIGFRLVFIKIELLRFPKNDVSPHFLSLKSMHVKYIENQCIFYVGYADGVDRQIKCTLS